TKPKDEAQDTTNYAGWSTAKLTPSTRSYVQGPIVPSTSRTSHLITPIKGNNNLVASPGIAYRPDSFGSQQVQKAADNRYNPATFVGPAKPQSVSKDFVGPAKPQTNNSLGLSNDAWSIISKVTQPTVTTKTGAAVAHFVPELQQKGGSTQAVVKLPGKTESISYGGHITNPERTIAQANTMLDKYSPGSPMHTFYSAQKAVAESMKVF
ncbi:MAG: hypothetical protein GY869_00185, partial [Planctomycetes bacterium]|nr:hypothetical protein [Planctomycetota bacterium]